MSSSAVWFDTEHELVIAWEDTIDPNATDPLQRGAAWCYPGGMTAGIAFGENPNTIRAAEWFATVPERSRHAVEECVRIAFAVVRGMPRTDATLARFIAELHRTIWRHVEGGPYR